MKSEFDVRTKSFALYQAFKEEVELIGYKHCASFSKFTAEQLQFCNCLYFADYFNSNDTPNAFAFSGGGTGCPTFDLGSEWDDALLFAKKNYSADLMTPKVFMRDEAEDFLTNHFGVTVRII